MIDQKAGFGVFEKNSSDAGFFQKTALKDSYKVIFSIVNVSV